MNIWLHVTHFLFVKVELFRIQVLNAAEKFSEFTKRVIY
jgi:hypothetical protein